MQVSLFPPAFSIRVPPDRCFSTTFVSGFALGGSCSMCFRSETWLPKASRWMLPQQGNSCLRRGLPLRPLLFAGWQVALRRPETPLKGGSDVQTEAASRFRRLKTNKKSTSLKVNSPVMGVRLFLGTVGGFLVPGGFKLMFFAHCMQYIFF